MLNFNNPFELMQFIQSMGENNALLQNRKEVMREVIYAAVAIYQTLFKCKDDPSKISSTFEYVNFLGWKYHESQQKPKRRGSADFSLKDLQKEIDESDPSYSSGRSTFGSIEVSDSDSEDNKPTKDPK